MVGMRIFLALIVFFFSAPLSYALRPSPEEYKEVEGQIEDVKESSPLSVGRAKSSHPFVYDIEIENPVSSDKSSLGLKAAPHRFTPKKHNSLLVNFVFFSILGICFLAAYYFIRPK